MRKKKRRDRSRREYKNMKAYTIREISGVDRPAQGPATMRIMKRDNDDVAKIMFEEALRAQNVSRQVMTALDDMWQYNSALRESIESIIQNPDEYPDPQKSIRESLESFVEAVDEMVSGVVVINKQQTKTEAGESFTAADYAYVPDPEKPSTWKLRLTSEPGGSPDPRIVGAAVAALGPGFRGNRVQIPEDDRPAVLRRVRRAWLTANPDSDQDDLPDILKSANKDGDPMTPEQLKKFEEMEARLKRFEAIESLTDDERGYFKGLDETKQDEFLAMDAEARKAAMPEATPVVDPGTEPVNKSDKGELVYKALDGTEFFAGDDERMISMAKRADAAEKRAAESEARRYTGELNKRAESDLANFPGESDHKVVLLKAVDGIEDAGDRDKVLEMLKSHNEALNKGFQTLGVDTGAAPNGPEAELEKLAQAHMSKSDTSYEAAYAHVIQTPEGRKLYKETMQG